MGTWLTPDASVDADLSDEKWFPFAKVAAFTNELPENSPPPDEAPPQGDPPNLDDKPPPGTNMDEWAAGVLSEAWMKIFNVAPNPIELQSAQAVARGESSYGWPSAEKFPSWQGHHNWGACHCMMRVDGKLTSCKQNGGCVKGFMGTDRINHVPTPTCFASFPTNVEGAIFFLTTLLVRRPNVKAVIGTGDAYRIALEMRKTSYFMSENTRDPKKMQADALMYAGLIMTHAKQVANGRNTKLLVHMSAPANIKPTDPNSSSWPRDVTDMTNYQLPRSTEPILGSVSGILVGIGLGALGIWGYKKWVRK